jgi:hypothetical protein
MLHTRGLGVTRGDRGAAGLLTLGGALVACAVALAVVLAVTSVGVTAARARIAADAGALAAMGASPLAGGAGSPDKEAVRLAAANGATVVAVDRSGWPLRVVVEVQRGRRDPPAGALAVLPSIGWGLVKD